MVHVNGVKYGTITIPKDSLKVVVADVAMRVPEVIGRVGNKTPTRIVYTPNKKINFTL